ncbi:FAD-binding oxidoreductase [Cupriavidus taiwanensis]|uniref:Putative FAD OXIDOREDUCTASE n=1 Tax=Cupriavidus taiwanensis TaxID=164546 RepID=A0A7Z7NKY9_9BURK|nr:FAD-binding oxidoreductase [Cupriavidus taiwanensis]SOY85510.1 putative FAD OXIDOREDUCTASE [Cupriavidus taiwanensis]SOZ03961.1 putative FAD OXIDOREDUCTASE [Cupriavidus taiwanensis]SOZ04374.1 putative FAD OXIDOREDUCTASE [Cupriavidus taiwanensis]SPC09810.1 putative FAD OXIDOREDUCTASE [Cupriavidus taiwanensis]SPD39595.1 putative FAD OXIDOREDUCTASE [Cupriavidus taiwanensis]
MAPVQDPSALLAELAGVLDPAGLQVGDAIETRFRKDWYAPLDPRPPVAVARPRSTAEVSAVLAICNRHRQPVVPQGGLTGLAGAATPAGGELVLSLERMRGVEEIDAQAGTMTVLAGTTLQAAQEAARAADWLFPVDLGARGSCQIGGNIATNAGGNRVIRYGMMREQVLGLEAVLADGTVVSSLNKMQKNNAGYDLRQLFVGSEGTLGVITRAVLRLAPLPGCTQTALCALRSYEDVVALLRHAQRRLSGRVSAFEAMWADFYELVTTRVPGVRAPLPAGSPFYVLVDLQGNDAGQDGAAFESMLETAMEAGLITDAAVATSEKEAEHFWKLRDAVAEFPVMWAPNAAYDVSLPIGQIGRFAESLRAAVLARWPHAELVNFGHVGDSNLHVSIYLPGATAEDFPEHEISEVLYPKVQEFDGSISAEHGIGTHKKPFLGHSRTPEALALMRSLKRSLDPNLILCPGRVIDVDPELPR